MSAEYDVAFGDQVVRLCVSPGALLLLEFLQAYFEPYFRFNGRGSGAPHGWTVRVQVGAAPNRVPAGAARFDVDRSGGFLRCEGRAVEGRRVRLVQLSPSDVIVRIDAAARTLALWGRSEADLRIPCLRVMEDLMTHELEHEGWVFVHASAVVAGNRAVLLCGEKGAGKTSGLCKLLRGFAVAQMANDNCLLRVRDGVAEARGWPGFFKVDVATIALHSELGSAFPSSARGLLDDMTALWNVYEKVPLYPREGAGRFGADVVAVAPVGCMIFPRFDDTQPPSLTRLSLAELADSFLACVQGSLHPNHPDWMGLGSLPAGRRAANIAAVETGLHHAELFALRWAPSFEDLLSCIGALRPFHHGVRASRTVVPADNAWPALPESL